MTYMLVLWLSFAPGRVVALEVPMPTEAACHKAVTAYRVEPAPNERVAYCRPLGGGG